MEAFAWLCSISSLLYFRVKSLYFFLSSAILSRAHSGFLLVSFPEKVNKTPPEGCGSLQDSVTTSGSSPDTIVPLGFG